MGFRIDVTGDIVLGGGASFSISPLLREEFNELEGFNQSDLGTNRDSFYEGEEPDNFPDADWEVVPGQTLTTQQPTAKGDSVYITAIGDDDIPESPRLYRYLIQDGSLVWDAPTGDTGNSYTNVLGVSSPVVGEEYVFTYSNTGGVTAHNKNDGSVEWTFRENEDFEDYNPFELLYSGDKLYGFKPPTPDGDSPNVFCVSVSGGGLVWDKNLSGSSFPSGKKVNVTPSGASEGVIVATTDTVYNLDPAKGTVNWEKDYIGDITGNASIKEGQVFLPVGGNNNIVSLDIEDGSVNWSTGVGFPADTTVSDSNRVYCIREGNQDMAGLDIDTGSEDWSVTTNQFGAEDIQVLDEILVVSFSGSGEYQWFDKDNGAGQGAAASIPEMARFIVQVRSESGPDASGLYLVSGNGLEAHRDTLL